jgi:HSP20 family protein
LATAALRRACVRDPYPMPTIKEKTMNIIRRNNATPLTGYRPAHLEDQFGRLVESMFDDFFAPFSQSALPRTNFDTTMAPRLTVAETDKSFEVELELPGVTKDDIKVAIDKQRVTVEAESKRESAQDEGSNVVFAERSNRKYLRSFLLPTDVDDSTAQAKLENGVLVLSLPKKQDTQAKRLTVQ